MRQVEEVWMQNLDISLLSGKQIGFCKNGGLYAKDFSGGGFGTEPGAAV